MDGIRITQQDVARRMGLTQATVSMAMSGNQRVAKQTRDRILQVAEEMGYRPDPVLSALIEHRRSKGKSEFKGTAAFLVPKVNPERYWQSPFAAGCLQGSREAAERSGFKLDIIQGSDCDSSRLRRLLKARGIRGLIIGPVTRNVPLDLDPDSVRGIACILIGRLPMDTPWARVAPNHFGGMLECFERALSAGFRRIAMVQRTAEQDVSGGRWIAGYQYSQYLHKHLRVPSLPVCRYANQTQLREWLTRHKPDAIIGTDIWMKRTLREIGYTAPKDLGFISLSTSGPSAPVSGIYQVPEEVGRQAMNQMEILLRSGRYGIPKYQTHTMVSGIWNAGSSI